MAHTHLYLAHDHTLSQQGTRKRTLLRRVINKATSVMAGTDPGGSFTMVSSGTDPASACTAGISLSGSGTVGIVVAGVTLTDTWATSDTVSAGLVAAAINGSTNAKIQYLLGATNLKTTVTLVTTVAGDNVTLAGFKFTGVAGTAASIPQVDGQFVIKGSGTDTQSGTSLAGAINRHPHASRFLFAYNIAGVVHVLPKSAAWFTGPNAPPNSNTYSSSTCVTLGTFAAATHYGIWVKVPGKIGNTIAQTVVARCRNDFTVASATPALVTGTQRRLSVTAGNYMDVEAVVNCTIDTAVRSATLRVFIDGSAFGEGASATTTGAADVCSLSTSVRYGPFTAAQALAGVVVELRVGVTQS